MKRRHVQMKESASASGLMLRRKLPTQKHDWGQSSLPFRPRRVKTYGRTKTRPEHLAVTARHRQLAASLGLPGRVDEGRAVVRRLLELVPDFTIARARRHIEFDMRTLPAEPRKLRDVGNWIRLPWLHSQVRR
jgi:hypothetical protein